MFANPSRHYFLYSYMKLRGGEKVSRQAHYLKIGGSLPSPATKNKELCQYSLQS